MFRPAKVDPWTRHGHLAAAWASRHSPHAILHCRTSLSTRPRQSLSANQEPYRRVLIGEIADNKGQVRTRFSGTEMVILDIGQANSRWQEAKPAPPWPKSMGCFRYEVPDNYLQKQSRPSSTVIDRSLGRAHSA